MDSNFKQWHKSVLFACVASLALGGSAMAQSDYISGPTYILNAFEASADEVLNGVNLWALGYETYQVGVYSSFNPSTGALGTLLASGTGTTTTGGSFDIAFGTSLALTSGNPYYLHVTSVNAVNFGYLGVKGNFSASFDSPLDNVSYFSSNGTTWTDLYDGPWTGLTVNGGGAVAAPANFLVGYNMSNITALPMLGSIWTIDAQSFTGPKTLDMDVTARDMEPFVTKIVVSSDMSSITLTEDVLNNDFANRDWTGFGFQLGYWDDVNERFVASTAGDGLSFAFTTSTTFPSLTPVTEDHIRFNGALLVPSEYAAFQLQINLPGGADSYTFALRQYAIPEPSSFLLLAMSGVMMMLCGRRRR